MTDLTSLDDIAPPKAPKGSHGCISALIIGFFGFIALAIGTWALFVAAAWKVVMG